MVSFSLSLFLSFSFRYDGFDIDGKSSPPQSAVCLCVGPLPGELFQTSTPIAQREGRMEVKIEACGTCDRCTGKDEHGGLVVGEGSKDGGWGRLKSLRSKLKRAAMTIVQSKKVAHKVQHTSVRWEAGAARIEQQIAQAPYFHRILACKATFDHAPCYYEGIIDRPLVDRPAVITQMQLLCTTVGGVQEFLDNCHLEMMEVRELSSNILSSVCLCPYCCVVVLAILME